MKIVEKIIRKTKVIPQDVYSFTHKNDIILYDADRKTRKRHVNLHWCSEKRADGKENVGDYLSVPIFDYMKKFYNIDDQKELAKTKHLYMVGSILFFGYQDATIWGSGLLCNPKFMWYKPKLDIRMVRGPHTREILLNKGYDCPEVYGDPAILMPMIYQPKNIKKDRKYSVILHKNSKYKSNGQIEIIRNGFQDFINEIVSSELIISNSLHGIILAETYGVPAILMTDKRDDFNFLKYEDYYFSTGRMAYPVANSLEEAIYMTPPPLPKLDFVRKKMIEAFPYDLWE